MSNNTQDKSVQNTQKNTIPKSQQQIIKDLTIQRIIDLSDDVPSIHHQVIIDGETFTFESLKKQIGVVLNSAPESNQQATALCMHVGELMARVECLEDPDIKLSESFKGEFVSVVIRLMGEL